MRILLTGGLAFELGRDRFKDGQIGRFKGVGGGLASGAVAEL